MTVEQKISLAVVVAIDQETMHGTPCFTGTRVPVQTLENGESIDAFLTFLELSRNTVLPV